MNTSETIATIRKCHEEGLRRVDIAARVGMTPGHLDQYIKIHKCARANMGFEPLKQATGQSEFEIPKARMSEEDIAKLFNGRKYDSLNIPSTGRAFTLRGITHVPSSSSMDF